MNEFWYLTVFDGTCQYIFVDCTFFLSTMYNQLVSYRVAQIRTKTQPCTSEKRKKRVKNIVYNPSTTVPCDNNTNTKQEKTSYDDNNNNQQKIISTSHFFYNAVMFII